MRRAFSTSSSARDALILSATRTPTGALLGSLSSLKSTELGSHAISHAVARSGLPAERIDEAFMGE